MKVANNIVKIFIISLLILISSLSINVNALTVPTSIKIKAKSSLYYFTENKKTDYINGYNFYRKELTDGTLAYCSSNISSHVPAGKTMSLKGEVKDKGLAYIIKNGYPNKKFTGNDLKDYYLTQAAVWRYFDETKGTKNWSKSTFSASSTGMKKHVYNLVQAAKLENKNAIVSSITASISSNTMNLNNEWFVSNPISVNLTEAKDTYKVELDSALAGSYIESLSGERKTEFTQNEKFVVKTPTTNKEGKIKVLITGVGVSEKVYEYTTKNSYYQDVIVVIPYEVETEIKTSLELDFKLDTKVSISKQDITNEKELAGATLVVKDSNSNIIDSWVSTDKPHYIEGLLVGDYTLTEIVAPEGYKLSSETINFSITTNGKVENVVMYNEREITRVRISKQDMANGKELAGATLVIKDSSSKEITRWVSTDKPHYIEGLPVGDYTLTEIIAPNGYKLSSETIKFTLKADGSIKTVTMLNEHEVTKVKISKQDIANGKELAGATLVIKDSNDREVAKWVSSNEPHYIEGLKEGSYTLTEIVAPEGYKLSSETISFRLVASGKVESVTMFNEREITRVRISKQDITNKTELAGATLIIKDSSGKEIDKWVSGSEPHYIEGLEEGTYTLTEIVAPVGYKLSSETITFNLKRDGKVKLVTMYNEKEVTKVKISKQDMANGKELAGASLVIKDSNGNIVDSWVSGSEPHYIEGLKEGSYTLTEIVAPNGYKLSSETIPFTLKADGSIKTVTMLNEREITRLKISKKDVSTNEELEGAKLVLRDKDGKEVARFISDDTSYYKEGLEEGTYYLSEEMAPDGYELSDEVIEFTLKANGKVETVVMYNTKITVVTKVSISKQDVTTKEELAGATLVIKDKDGNIVESWISTDKPHYVEGLQAGDYTLTETMAPYGYRLSSETINFKVNEDGSLTKVVMYNTKKIVKLKVSKQDLDTKKELVGATLAIKNSNGDIVDKWISSTEPHYTESLEEGNYSLVELEAPNGYKLNNEGVKFSLKDSDKVTSIVIYNEKKEVTKVSISKQDITNKTELAGATLIVRDKNNMEIDRWVSTDKPHYIEGLAVGEYTLTELIAPNGYILSTETIKFMIEDDGKIKTVVMYNELKPVTKVLISKQDITTKKELAGATLVIRDVNGNVVDKWISGTNAHYVEGLQAGEYILSEEIAPDDYALSTETIKFSVLEDGTMTKVVMYNTKLTKIPITDLNFSSISIFLGSIISFVGAAIILFYKKITL